MISTGGPTSDVARNFSRLAQSPITWGWVMLILGLQAWISAVGGPQQPPARTWFETFGLTRTGVESGRIWQVVTYAALHAGWWHAGLNGLFLLVVGSRIEHVAGRGGLVKAIIFGVLGGAIGHLFLTAGGEEAPLLVGFSGGCMGLLLLLTTLSPQSRMTPIPVSAKSLGLGVLVAEGVLALADPTMKVPGFSGFGRWLAEQGMGSWFEMGHACHLGGGVSGWLYGRWLLRPRVSLEHLRRDRARREGMRS